MSKQEKSEEKVEKKLSPAKQAFKDLIERYRVANPVKFELKKAELERKLANIE